MKSITAFLTFILILLLGECKNDAEKRVIKGCKDVCRKNTSIINLTEAFKICCKEAEECLLPEQFYNFSCRLQMMDSCLKNQGNTSAIKQIRIVCCPQNNFTTQRKKCTKRSKITVKWKGVNFKTKYDLVEEAWKKETWTFFLKMASQKCIEKLTVRSRFVQVTISYPYYTNDNSETVFGYKSPPAYLVEQKKSFTMFTVVSSSFSRMWVTLFLCVIWSLISGVFIWLMVSKHLGFVLIFNVVCRRCDVRLTILRDCLVKVFRYNFKVILSLSDRHKISPEIGYELKFLGKSIPI